MAIIIVLLSILGSAVFLYFKGTIVRSFACILSAIFACIAAFAYFEPLASFLIKRGTMVPSAYTVSFLLLFVLTFVICLALTLTLTRWPVDFGSLPERIGRVVCGIIVGLLLSGAVLTALAMGPPSPKSPYQRFDSANPDIDKPHRSLLNTDGFVTGLFSFASRGSLSGKTPFSAVHPNFLNQLFLNRIGANVPAATSTNAIEIPSKAAVWPAPANLKTASGKPLPTKSGAKPMIAQIGIKQSAQKDAGQFTLAQLNLICKEKTYAKDLLAGKATIVYPIGYLKAPDCVQTKNLTDKIIIEPADFVTPVRWLDFVFNVPENLVPVMAQFKQNNIVQLPPPVAADESPPPQPFIPQADCAPGAAQLQPAQAAAVYGIELFSGAKFLEGLTLEIKDMAQWKFYQTGVSIEPAQFEDDKIIQTRAELMVKEPNKADLKKAAQESQPTKTPARKKKQRFLPKFTVVEIVSTVGNMLKPIDGYTLLSLKCNTPAVGAELKGEQLPVLIELSGLVHHTVGVIAAGKIDKKTVWEVDYCSVPISEDPNASGCLAITKNDTVEKPFPDTVWLTEKAKEITEFYTLYMVKAVGNPLITGVKPTDANAPQKFEKYEAFSVK
jgi:uncharacterized membrane protein required for colicin V production